jgi:hypothetical protein
METLAHLVTESLVRHGFETTFDHRSLQWSQWFPCQDRFGLLLAPCKPGLFALSEEVATFCGASEPRSRHPERSEGCPNDGKRMLALFQISEALDLGMALGRLFLSNNPERERLNNGRCFARYVVIEDATQRRTAHTALQRWMAASAETVSRNTDVALDAPVRGAERNSAGFVSGHDSQDAGFVSKHNQHEAGFVSGHDFSRATKPATLTTALAAASANPADASEQPQSSNRQAQIGLPTPFPSGF